MNTVEICEHICFVQPKMREKLYHLGISDTDRQIQSVYHPEFTHALSNFEKFENVGLIVTYGLIQTILIISFHKRSKLYTLLSVVGYETELLKLSKTGIVRHLMDRLNMTDFLPKPLTRKVIYVKRIDFSKENFEGVVFSEGSRNYWTVEDPLMLDANFINVGAGSIISNVVEDMFLEVS